MMLKLDKESIPRNLTYLQSVARDGYVYAVDLVKKERLGSFKTDNKLISMLCKNRDVLDMTQWYTRSNDSVFGIVGVSGVSYIGDFEILPVKSNWVHLLDKIIIAESIGGDIYLNDNELELFKEILELSKMVI